MKSLGCLQDPSRTFRNILIRGMEGQNSFQWLPQEVVGWAVHGYKLFSSRTSWPNVHKTFLSDEELETWLFVLMLERPLCFSLLFRGYSKKSFLLKSCWFHQIKDWLPYFNPSLEAKGQLLEGPYDFIMWNNLALPWHQDHFTRQQMQTTETVFDLLNFPVSYNMRATGRVMMFCYCAVSCSSSLCPSLWVIFIVKYSCNNRQGKVCM